MRASATSGSPQHRSSPNHNIVFTESHSELFKWASDDDLYARNLVNAASRRSTSDPDVVLAHTCTAIIDAEGTWCGPVEYPLATASPRTPERFRSMLFDDGGDDDYGVIRSEVLRRTPPYASYHRADRTFMAELALHGRFHQVPEWLYFRRDHPDRAERAKPTIRTRSANMDPRRADWRHPAVRLLAEYVFGFVGVIRRSPVPAAERLRCYRYLAGWLAKRALSGSPQRLEDTVAPAAPTAIPVSAAVPGREVP